jgi:hypothetical protein
MLPWALVGIDPTNAGAIYLGESSLRCRRSLAKKCCQDLRPHLTPRQYCSYLEAARRARVVFGKGWTRHGHSMQL